MSVVEKAARSTGDSVANTLKRHKSQAYLFGRLRHHFPAHDEQELRDLIAQLRQECADDPDAQRTFDRPSRPPPKGREPAESPVWEARTRQLLAIIDTPLTTEELKDKAARELRWSLNFFISVIAAADIGELLEYKEPYWMPAPGKERRMSKSNRTATKKVTRPVEVVLSEDEEKSLVEELKKMNYQRGTVIAQLTDKERDIRARHRLEMDRECSALRHKRRQIEQELQNINDQLTSGTVIREIECEERRDFEKKMLFVVRMDTRDVIDRRPLEAEERQMEIA